MLDEVSTTFLHAFAHGGFVMPPLCVITVVLWWALGERAFALRPRLLVEAQVRLSALRDVAVGEGATPPASVLEVAVADLEDQAHRGSTLIRSLVIIAPLLGLLGTVTGMIETFDSLAEMALFRQSGGVAGGVSQALISTQAGLCVAIPGLLLGKLLDRVERRRLDELDRLVLGSLAPKPEVTS